MNKKDTIDLDLFKSLMFKRYKVIYDLDVFYFQEIAPLIKECKNLEEVKEIWDKIRDLCPRRKVPSPLLEYMEYDLFSFSTNDRRHLDWNLDKDKK